MSTAVRERPTTSAPPAPDEPVSLWPLALVFVAFPLWWLLGVSSFIPMLAVLPMAVQLWRRRSVLVPPGFAWWLVFLVWVLFGAATLWTDAPGAVPGGGGLNRVAVYGYRLCWYLTCTVVLLWVANTSRRALPFAKVARLIGWLFVFTVLGGLLGVFASALEFPSLLELVLPSGLTNNSFVHSLIHPGVADVQLVLGRPEARPKAPFAFANSWGSMFSLTLPFFLLGWWKHGRHWQRVVVPVALLLGAIPVVYSLNRGLWFSLVLGAAFLVVLQASRGRMGALVLVLAGLTAATVVLVASPLGGLVVERFQNQHSNERRGDLLVETVASTVTGSPVVGFGNTRDVQGSFASIAGASTPDCSACGVPPLGTQGHLWLVIFSQGLVGAVLFVVFFAGAFFRNVRSRSEPETLATCLLLFLGLQVFIYDTLGLPLFVVMIALGLAWREQHATAAAVGHATRVPTLRGYVQDFRRAAVPIAVLAITGALLGSLWAAAAPRTYTARELVLLEPSPSYLVTGLASSQTPQESTIDTEASLVLGDETLRRITGFAGTLPELRSKVTVTAVPNTQVLVLDVADRNPVEAERLVDELSTAYLDVRNRALQDRRSQVLGQLRNRYSELTTLGTATGAEQLPAGRSQGAVGTELREVDTAINSIVLTPTSAGDVLRQEGAEQASRNFPMFAASGAALGLLAALLLTVLRARLLQRGGRRELAEVHA